MEETVSRVTTLRVGVCGCSQRYQGRLQDQTLKTNGKTFFIHEVYVSEKERETLHGARCHFFVDTHFVQNKFLTTFTQLVFASNGKNRGWKLLIGWGISGSSRPLKRSWVAKRQPSASQLVQTGIANLLKRMSQIQLEQWLANTTPPMCLTD